MQECSAYCRPNENIHVFRSNGTDFNGCYSKIGTERKIKTPSTYCVPSGAMVVVLNVEHAVEVEQSTNPLYPVPLLTTVLLLGE